MNKDLQSIGDTPIKTHSMPKHCRVSYVNESYDTCTEEMKTKASDLDRLTEQIRQKQTLGSTTSEEKIKIFTLTTESWSISH